MHHKKWKKYKKNVMKHDIIKYQTWLLTKICLENILHVY